MAPRAAEPAASLKAGKYKSAQSRRRDRISVLFWNGSSSYICFGRAKAIQSLFAFPAELHILPFGRLEQAYGWCHPAETAASTAKSKSDF